MRHFKFVHLDYVKPESPLPEPTPRELEVEDLLCRGYSQENIAAIFGRSVNTISAQVVSLYRKRGVNTRIGLLLAYLERKGIFVFPQEGHERIDKRLSLEAALR